MLGDEVIDPREMVSDARAFNKDLVRIRCLDS